MRRLCITLALLATLGAGLIVWKTREVPLSHEASEALTATDHRSLPLLGVRKQLPPPAMAPFGTGPSADPIGRPTPPSNTPESAGVPFRRHEASANRSDADLDGGNESIPAVTGRVAWGPVDRAAAVVGSEGPPSEASNELTEVAVSSVPGLPAISVPAGAQLPALFHDERPLPSPQRRALDRIANEFIDAVSTNAAGSDGLAMWNAARASADQKYITLFGHAAYNALHLQTAKEAVREKRAALASQVGP